MIELYIVCTICGVKELIGNETQIESIPDNWVRMRVSFESRGRTRSRIANELIIDLCPEDAATHASSFKSLAAELSKKKV